MKAITATVKQNNVIYTKLNISDFEKGQLSLMGHTSRWNHYVFDLKHARSLSDAQRSVRMAARNGACLFIDGDYFVRL